MSNQPTILVKKKDGTSVRLTMDEFKIYKEHLNTLAPKHDSTTAPASALRAMAGKPDHPITLPPKHDSAEAIGRQKIALPAKQNKQNDLAVAPAEQHLAMTAPVKEIFVDEALSSQKSKVFSQKSDKKSDDMSQEWQEDDHKSLLEEKIIEVKEVKKDAQDLPGKKADEVEVILRGLSFQVRNDLRGRLQSLIVSRLKEVRSDEQVFNYALRSEAEGGLGLNNKQANELIKAINSSWHVPDQIKFKPQANKRKTEQIAPERIVLADDQLRENKLGKVLASKVHEHRAMIHDVVALQTPVGLKEERDVVIDPIDEMRLMTITDFRRLAVNAEKSVAVLESKFIDLRHEFFLNYLQAIKAWQSSPLYKQYLDIIKQAINNRQTISAVLNEINSLSAEEFKAIAGLNEHLTT